MKSKSPSTTDRALNAFLRQHQDEVMGILHGLDRVRFLGKRLDANFTGKVVTDLHRRAQLSRAANERYLAAMADANDATTLAVCILVASLLPLQGGLRAQG